MVGSRIRYWPKYTPDLSGNIQLTKVKVEDRIVGSKSVFAGNRVRWKKAWKEKERSAKGRRDI